MIQELLERIEEAVNKQVKDQFGLSDEQTEKTQNAFRESILGIINKNTIKNPQFIQSVIENFSSMQESEAFLKFKESLNANLQEKVGLSPEKAAAIRDFSVSEFFKTLSSELTNEEGKMDMQKILEKFNVQELEQTAKGFLENLGGLFRK